MSPTVEPVVILMAEDDLGDVALTEEALRRSKLQNEMHVVPDGVEAMAFLRREGDHIKAPRPDLILLDLNMPRMDGREVLEEIKSDEELRSIPVVVLTTSDAERDIARSYELQANCYITKPVDLDQFREVVQTVSDFWFCLVKLPPRR